MFIVLVSDLTFSLPLSLPPAQLAGVVFLGVGLWAWSEKVGVPVTTILNIRQSKTRFLCSALLVPPNSSLTGVFLQGNGLLSVFRA